MKNTVLPYKFYTKATCVPPEAFGPYDANTLIPRFTQRESIKMIVSGGRASSPSSGCLSRRS